MSKPAPKRFLIDIPSTVLNDLHDRLRRTRWPSGVTDSGGLVLADAQRLVSYWIDDFDWYGQQTRLNSYAQFIVEIDGLNIHFVHIKSTRSDAPPLLLLHGWPGSFVEFLSVVDRLRESYQLVVPSLPGYGFSSPATSAGMSNKLMADVMVTLMRTLGYERFGVHGGDVGAGVATWLAFKYPDRTIGLHLNFIPGSYVPSSQSDETQDERDFILRRSVWVDKSGAYSHQQRTRPLTLSYSLSDSPAGLAAWIAEKVREWADPASAISRDTILTNVTIYWVTNSIASSVRVYLESSATPLRFEAGQRVAVPTGIAHCPFDTPFPPRSWVGRAYDVRRWTELPRGGHFAALETPELLAEDIDSFFDDVIGGDRK